MADVYHCGTLTYTKLTLAFLVLWLLWGDFCYQMMEAITPSLMPLKFQSLGASNFQIGLIGGTIPSMVYIFFTPIISFKSDRFRSRWGRRIPFIVVTTPFLVLGLVGLAYADRIGFWLHANLGTMVAGVAPNTFAIWTVGALLVFFGFFNTFVCTVFWYLFNDVVPEHLLARFMSWFRMVSMGATAFYNFCIFGYAGTHYSEILIWAAVLYFIGFGLMCYFVKEGDYPPPPPYDGGETGPVAAIKTYARECHALPHYWYQWICSFVGSIGGGAAYTFEILFLKAIGLNLTQTGAVRGSLGIATGVLILASGWLADKYHPIRVIMVGVVIQLFIYLPANMVWIFWLPSSQVAFYIMMAMTIFLRAPSEALIGVWDPPLLMRIFPRERYGQFCSTNGIWRTCGGLIGGTAAGEFLDIMTKSVGPDRAYYFIPVWQIVFTIPSFFCLIGLYYSWKKYGGDDNYVAPVPVLKSDTVEK